MARSGEAVAANTIPQNALRYILIGIGALLMAVFCAAVYNRIDHFLITDSRFILPPLPEGLWQSSTFRIEGAHFASEKQIADVFARDFGRSAYLCPIVERRRLLLAVSWVKDATVSRIWPNELVVRIKERTPVAFVQFQSTHGAAKWGLIDSDGVFLDPKRTIKVKLPVLMGLGINDSEKIRASRVAQLKKLQTDLGTLMDRISEVDVGDSENIQVTVQMEDRTLVLMLGNANLRQRMENFLNNYVEIRKRMAHAQVLDCRLPDRIIAVEPTDGPGGAGHVK